MKKIDLNQGWLFSGGDVEILEERIPARVDLPHDYVITVPRHPDSDGRSGNGYFPGGMGEYRRAFTGPGDERVLLMIDGAYMNAEVYLNGNALATHPYGYAPFCVDLSDQICRDAENTLRIITQSRQPGTRWYSGGGLYREVCLLTGPEKSIFPWSVYARCVYVNAGTAVVIVDFRVDGPAAGKAQIELVSPDGSLAARTALPVHAENRAILGIDGPRLWTLEDPALYQLRITLDNGETHTQRLGLRIIEIDAHRGFRLNGIPMKLRGGCLHHDNGPLGAVSCKDAELRKIRLLKGAGYTAVRCAHNPPSQVFLEACDELGMLVMDEAFDCWNEGKNPQDYHLYFREWWERDIEAMVLSARNHPCVFSYSIGNEIPERDGHGDGAQWAKRLADKVRSLDPERPVTCGVNGLTRPGSSVPFLPQFGTENYRKLRLWDPRDDYWGEKTEAFCEALDFVGYNYMMYRYAHDRDKYPDRAIAATESFPAMTYPFWKSTLEHGNVFGDFIWTAFDYLGEAGIGRTMYADEPDRLFPGAYPWHQANTGDFDICGFRTAQSYYREIMWGLREGPHLRATHPLRSQRPFGGFGWNWDDSERAWNFGASCVGLMSCVGCYTNAEEVEFLLNGVSLGRENVRACMASLLVPYQPGRLEARAYREDRMVGRDYIETNGPAHRIVVSPDREALPADGRSMCYITVELVDREGRPVSNDERAITVTIAGPGRLTAVGSGDPRSEEGYTGSVRTTFQGRMLAIVKSGTAPGSVRAVFTSPGLETAALEIPVTASILEESL